MHPPTGTISTFTHRTEKNDITEVILVPLDAAELGSDASYPPPSIEIEALSSWMRSKYFFMNQQAIAQIPRNADDLPLDQSASEVTDILYREDVLEMYYPVNRNKAVCVTWEYPTDSWNAGYVDCDIRDGSINLNGLDDGFEVVWSINPSKYSD